MDNPFDLTGNLVLITGGGSGLGLAMAKAIVNAGGSVVITGRTENSLRTACEQIGPLSHYMIMDVRDKPALPAFVAQVEETYGPITGLINNAGNHLKKPIGATSDEEFLSVMETHVFGGFALTRECAARMMTRGTGSIIFITSMSALFGLTNTVAYTAAKSALAGMMRELAVELSPKGIRVNAIAPGFMESKLLRQAFAGDPERERKVMERTPLHQLGTPEDVGFAAVFLCSPGARFITGTQLVVDGGMSIGF